MTISQLFRIEFIKLFRRSNVLFFFLAIYVIITGYESGLSILREETEPLPIDLFKALSHGMSVWSLLFMALFMVNNIGNEIVEGTFRKNIAMGLSRRDYYLGKLILMVLFNFMVISFLWFSYFLFVLLSNRLSVLQIEIPPLFIFTQFVSLSIAGLFGMCFIMAFRNRIIGLVFFPFWFVPEFFIFIMESSGRFGTSISDYLPGVTAFKLFSGSSHSWHVLVIGIVIAVMFGIISWFGLRLREEKPL